MRTLQLKYIKTKYHNPIIYNPTKRTEEAVMAKRTEMDNLATSDEEIADYGIV